MRRRALELLASRSERHHQEAAYARPRVDGDMIAGLVRTRLATAERETTKAGGKTIETFASGSRTPAGRRPKAISPIGRR